MNANLVIALPVAEGEEKKEFTKTLALDLIPPKGSELGIHPGLFSADELTSIKEAESFYNDPALELIGFEVTKVVHLLDGRGQITLLFLDLMKK